MLIKYYYLHKTAKKTAGENNLIIADNKKVFDFSLLKNCEDIAETEKSVIIDDALKNINNANCTSFYGKQFNNFEICEGIGKFYKHRIFSKEGKYLYTIFQLTELNHRHSERRSVYDNFTPCSINICDQYDRPVEDIEI